MACYNIYIIEILELVLRVYGINRNRAKTLLHNLREIKNNIELHITFYELSCGIREWNGGTQIASGLRACGRRVKTTT